MSEAGTSNVNFDVEDFGLFARYPSSRPWGEISAPDKARFKSIRDRLKAIAKLAAGSYSTSLQMKEHASLFAPNGRSATDLWCCIYPAVVPNKSFGLQFALILNSLGAEFCCCLGAGTSQVSDTATAQHFLEGLARTKSGLRNLDRSVSDAISAAIGNAWDFRKQWRLTPGTRDYASFAEWAQYASSPASAGASISKNLDIATVVQLGSRIGDEFQRYATLFKPLMEAIYNEPQAPKTIERREHLTISSLTSREAVLKALREFDELGREGFLEKYGFGPALEYFLVHDGRRYDSKAVAGVAVGKQFPERGPMRNNDFSGGLASAVGKLRELGFEVVQESNGFTSGRAVIKQPTYTAANFATETKISKDTIERWLARLRRKHQIILQGPPGTGKTFIAERLARVLVSETVGLWDVVQFHPSYAYEDFIQGIRPKVVSGALAYEIEPGRFVEFCERASKTDAPAVLIVDEINRANLSRVFGELMYLLEYREKSVPLASGGKPFKIPKNVYLIGTMNTADRSIALVDHALRRRFSFIYLEPDYEVLRAHLSEHELPVDSLVKTLKAVNAAIEDRNYWIGTSFFLTDGKQLRTTLSEIWRGEIEPYLEEYFYDRLDRAKAFQWESLIKKELEDWA